MAQHPSDQDGGARYGFASAWTQALAARSDQPQPPAAVGGCSAPPPRCGGRASTLTRGRRWPLPAVAAAAAPSLTRVPRTSTRRRRGSPESSAASERSVRRGHPLRSSSSMGRGAPVLEGAAASHAQPASVSRWASPRERRESEGSEARWRSAESVSSSQPERSRSARLPSPARLSAARSVRRPHHASPSLRRRLSREMEAAAASVSWWHPSSRSRVRCRSREAASAPASVRRGQCRRLSSSRRGCRAARRAAAESASRPGLSCRSRRRSVAAGSTEADAAAGQSPAPRSASRGPCGGPQRRASAPGESEPQPVMSSAASSCSGDRRWRPASVIRRHSASPTLCRLASGRSGARSPSSALLGRHISRRRRSPRRSCSARRSPMHPERSRRQRLQNFSVHFGGGIRPRGWSSRIFLATCEAHAKQTRRNAPGAE
mmetsp:Transcript_17107/g.40830  ORF Transcript_17107/g.40830 Transcript_17107/m.40830 type:complete len:433 (+) Transcript_17107:468-1766(+)